MLRMLDQASFMNDSLCLDYHSQGTFSQPVPEAWEQERSRVIMMHVQLHGSFRTIPELEEAADWACLAACMLAEAAEEADDESPEEAAAAAAIAFCRYDDFQQPCHRKQALLIPITHNQIHDMHPAC